MWGGVEPRVPGSWGHGAELIGKQTEAGAEGQGGACGAGHVGKGSRRGREGPLAPGGRGKVAGVGSRAGKGKGRAGRGYMAGLDASPRAEP